MDTFETIAASAFVDKSEGTACTAGASLRGAECCRCVSLAARVPRRTEMARKRKTAEKGSKDDCRGNPGKVAPVIDRNRCEGKEDCAIVCPYDVFEIGTLSPEDRASLSLVGKLKAWANGNRQAFVMKPLECHACNLCVDACPEDALVLAAVR